MGGGVFRVPYTAVDGNGTGRNKLAGSGIGPLPRLYRNGGRVRSSIDGKKNGFEKETLLEDRLPAKHYSIPKMVRKAVEKVSGNGHQKERTVEHILSPPPLAMADEVALAIYYADLQVPLNGNGKKTPSALAQQSGIGFIKAKIAKAKVGQAASFAAWAESDAQAFCSELVALRKEFKKRVAALEAEKPPEQKPVQTIVDYVRKNGVKSVLLASGAAVAILSKWLDDILQKAADFLLMPWLAAVPVEIIGGALGSAALVATAIQYAVAKVSQKRAPAKAKQRLDEEKTELVRRYEDARTSLLNRLELAYYYRIIDHEEYWPVLRSAYPECYAVLASEHSSEAAKEWLMGHKVPSQNILNKNGTYVFGEDKPNPLPYSDVQLPVQD